MSANQAEPSSYLEASTPKERLAVLKEFIQKDQTLPLPLVRDLLYLNLSQKEHILLLQCADAKNPIALEDFLTRGLFHWEQNVASIALRSWAYLTPNLLWHRTLPLVFDDKIAQRLSYTLLEMAWHGGGDILIEKFTKLTALESMSPAFLSLLFNRALTWHYQSDRLLEISLSYLRRVNEADFSADKTIPPMIAYLAQFAPKKLSEVEIGKGIGICLWSDMIKGVTREQRLGKKLKDLDKKLKKDLESPEKKPEFLPDWPVIWQRQELPTETVALALKVALQSQSLKSLYQEDLYMLFGGIGSNRLLAATLLLESPIDQAHTAGILGNLLNLKDQNVLTERFKTKLSKDRKKELEPFKKALPKEFGLQLGTLSEDFSEILQERLQVLIKPQEMGEKDLMFKVDLTKDASQETKQREEFIKLVFEGGSFSSEATDQPWHTLAKAWHHPRKEDLDSLAKAARTLPPLLQAFYIMTLGRFHGADEAALKLLDYVRHHDPLVISYVISSLGKINTQRSLQELVAFLTRPNVTHEQKIDIATILHEKDLSQLQAEIRSAISDMGLDQSEDEVKQELKEALQELIIPSPPSTSTEPEPAKGSFANAANAPTPTSVELDQHLLKKIPLYHRLSSEVKRALRTAQFFHLQVNFAGNLKTIDLSPAIDMQYKALELSFRECFETPCSIIINQGILQRKLDIIGYARPIPQAMEDFERYIEKLPIITTVPFFSRFKLRKMLRALCQYRKGKRFTLDGLKAFGLFFVCFSRKDCRYGLHNLFPIKNLSDEELFEFVKTLHMFQDFRNRAAHEGFHPDASNNLDTIWEHTASIVDTMFQVADHIDIGENYHAGKNHDQVEIVHKSAS